jgi:putative ABC transport system permease protein
MSAVWRAARAAVKRRRLQTFIIGLVVFFSTASVVLALGLVTAASAPFDRAFAQQSGAHVVAAFDPIKTTSGQLAGTAGRPGVAAAAGPFAQALLSIPLASGARYLAPVLTVVGRADPAGPVDRLDLWDGHWATGPGQIVLNFSRGNVPAGTLGQTIAVPGLPTLTIVGFAYSVTQTADAWVSPDQIAALHPTATQMLYRFKAAATSAEIRSDLAAVTVGLPSGAVLGTQSYLSVRDYVNAQQGTFLPFLMVFGILGLVVAVMIVANVISGAVVAGFRHIGILKALGFTPSQVVAIYLVMVFLPAILGCVLGTVLGNVLAQPLLNNTFQAFGAVPAIAPWVDVLALLGMPALIGLAAIVPALRARRVSAVAAISAGNAPRPGRGLRVQRRLSGARLPRSVSLGLGLPFARPGRSVLTMAAVVLGVTSVTFAIGLTSSLTRFGNADPDHHAAGTQAVVQPGHAFIRGEVAPKLSDPGIESLLGSLPGAEHVIAERRLPVGIVGGQSASPIFYRGDPASLGYALVKGRWYHGSGEIVVSSMFLHQHGVAIGDGLTLDSAGSRARVTIVGEVMTGGIDVFLGDWALLERLAPGSAPDDYRVLLASGTDLNAYLAAVHAADPGLYQGRQPDVSSFNATVIGFATLLTLMLGTVAALGVFNTVVLNTRERRRDLGMLKSIGMTPGQVTVMMVTSMAMLGAAGGLLGVPLGVFTHRLVLPLMGKAAQVDLPSFIADVWTAPTMALLVLAGVGIAALGALIPAGSAARLTIAEVLHGE